MDSNCVAVSRRGHGLPQNNFLLKAFIFTVYIHTEKNVVKQETQNKGSFLHKCIPADYERKLSKEYI